MFSPQHAPLTSASPPQLRGPVIGVTVLVAGFLAYMFWPSEPPVVIRETSARKAPEAVVPVQATLPARLASGLTAVKLDLEVPEAFVSKPDLRELTLTERLDDFFLTSISLEKLLLGQAVARLKQMLHETDKDKSLALHKLIVTVPTSALGRLVTLHTPSISYLEAVQTLAALAGCEVDVGEHRITLKTLPGPWPETAERQSLLNVLEGLFNQDGKPMSQDLGRVAQIKEDASRLGLRLDKEDSASLTASQRKALRRMMDDRSRMESALIPPFAVYLLPEGFLAPIFQVTPEQVLQLMATLHQQGFVPYSDVPYSLLDPTIAQQILFIARSGGTVTVSQHTTIPIAKQAEVVVAAPDKRTIIPVTNIRYGYGILRVGVGSSLTIPTKGTLVSLGEGILLQAESSSSVPAAEVNQAAAGGVGSVDGNVAGPKETVPTTPFTAPEAPQ